MLGFTFKAGKFVLEVSTFLVVIFGFSIFLGSGVLFFFRRDNENKVGDFVFLLFLVGMVFFVRVEFRVEFCRDWLIWEGCRFG